MKCRGCGNKLKFTEAIYQLSIEPKPTGVFSYIRKFTGWYGLTQYCSVRCAVEALRTFEDVTAR